MLSAEAGVAVLQTCYQSTSTPCGCSRARAAAYAGTLRIHCSVKLCTTAVRPTNDITADISRSVLQTLCRSMSGNIRAADVTAGVLAFVILASVAVAVTPSPHAAVPI